MRMQIKTLTLVALASLTLACSAQDLQNRAAGCGEPGRWLAPTEAGARPTDAAALLDRLAAQQAVLLGETHDSAEDHRWQLHTLAQLHARRPSLAIGFEMFPRRLQPVLDRWVAGELSEAEFLRQAEWDRVWGFDARLYLPLFHYARMNRLPMLALNVERDLVDQVGKEGWDAVPADRREGLGRPAAPLPDYRTELKTVFAHHPEKKQDEASFERFVEAQTVWDRAMASGIAAHLARQPDALVVGILGAGHVRHGYGVAHQLKDLGVTRVAGLMTWDVGQPCSAAAPGLADALYAVATPAENPPRLGVAMEPAEAGVRVAEVVRGSVAEAAGIKAGDVLTQVAGRPAASLQAVRQAVQRQAPGTWLPLKVRRDGADVDLVARFPPES
jgi:uncharacterized iron-regulated protein